MKFRRAVSAVAGMALFSAGVVAAAEVAQADRRPSSQFAIGSGLADASTAYHRGPARHRVSKRALPGPVTIAGFSFRASGSGLEVGWRPASGATGYRVVWKDADSGVTIPSSQGTSAYSSLIAVQSGTHTYVVSVTPYNQAGDGPTATAQRTATGRSS
jgi:hypothetical protein